MRMTIFCLRITRLRPSNDVPVPAPFRYKIMFMVLTARKRRTNQSGGKNAGRRLRTGEGNNVSQTIIKQPYRRQRYDICIPIVG